MQVEEAQSVAPEAHNGIFTIESSEQFDALLTLNAEREVVLVAGLSWCRPCRSLTRPMEKLATHYHDGAVFAKVLGDVNDNTKRFFKDRLKVRSCALFVQLQLASWQACSKCLVAGVCFSSVASFQF